MFVLILFIVFLTSYACWEFYHHRKQAQQRQQQYLLEEQRVREIVEAQVAKAQAAHLKAEEERRKTTAEQLAVAQAKEVQAQQTRAAYLKAEKERRKAAEAQAAYLKAEEERQKAAEQLADAQAKEVQAQQTRTAEALHAREVEARQKLLDEQMAKLRAEANRQREAARLELARKQAAEREAIAEAKKAEYAKKQAEELRQAQRELAAKTQVPKSSPVTSPQPIANPGAPKPAPAPAPAPLSNTPQHNPDALAYCEQDSSYCATLAGRFNGFPELFSFDAVRGLTRDQGVFNQLESGVRILDTHEQLMQYIFSYGKMHKAKLYESFDVLLGNGKIDLTGKDIQLFDYGCGQALATVLLIDYLRRKGNTKFKSISVVLIEPSEAALKRAALHARYSLKSINHTGSIAAYCIKLNDISKINLCPQQDSIQFHLFSNILDVTEVDYAILHGYLKNQLSRQSYFVCVSPNLQKVGPWHPRNRKLHEFTTLFCVHQGAKLISDRESDIPGSGARPWTRFERVFGVGLEVIHPAHNNSLIEDDNSFTVI